jgi:hypothetical protein
MPPEPHRQAPEDRLRRRAGKNAGRGAGDDRGGQAKGKPMSVGLLGNIVDVLPELLERGIRPDA